MLACVALLAASSCRKTSTSDYRRFAKPEDAVQALISAASKDTVEPILAIFGPAGKALIDTSDAASARRGRQVFAAAAAEGWHLEDRSDGAKTLIVGNEQWPFPVPLVRDPAGWRFDTEAGREEIITRRIGRNELAVIEACETYVLAQHVYASASHDGKPSGVYAAVFRSDAGHQNGLYWAPTRGGKRSPLGDLLAAAADPGRVAAGAGEPAGAIPWLLLPDSHRAGALGARRGQELRGERRDDRRIRAGGLAGAVRRHRRDDVHCERRRDRPSERSWPQHGCGRTGDDSL